MAKPDRSKSLQEILRARREAKPLLTVAQLRRREAERQREEVEEAARREVSAIQAAAAEALEARRQRGKRIDAAGKLPEAVYGAIFAVEPEAYYASNHWSRRTRIQLAAASACEVVRCGEREEVRAYLLERDAVGKEQAGRDLITLCAACERRVLRLEREAGRPVARAELIALDPEEPLYEASEIAALKQRYARPLRRKDLQR